MLRFNFLRRRDYAETADLRDRLIQAESRLIFLEDKLSRPTRERRKDARDIKDAKLRMTTRLQLELGRTPDQLCLAAVEGALFP